MCRTLSFFTFIAFCALFTGCEVNSRFDCSSRPCPNGQRCSAQFKLCVADEGPVVTLTSPVSMAVVPGNALKVEGTVADDSEGAVTLSISTDGVNFEPVTVDTAGHFAVELTLGTMDHALFRVTLKATDAAGVSSNTEVAVNIDNVKPRCALISPSDAGFLNGSGNTVFRIQFDDGSPSLSEQQLTVDELPLAATLTDGVVSAVWPAAPAENGVTHTMRYQLADAAGNTCEGQASFVLDNVPPVLTVTHPLPNALLNNAWFANTAWVSGPAATDQSNPAPTVTVNWDDGAGAKPTTAVDGGYRFVVSKVDEDFRVHQVKVTATDWAGNTTDVVVPVTVDTVAPRITFLSPDAGARFNASAFASSGDLTVTFDVQDGDADAGVTATHSHGAADAKGGSYTFQTSAADNGRAYQMTVKATDRAGNTTTQYLDFSVDRVAPTVVSITPARGTRNFDNTRSLSVTFSEKIDTNSPAALGVDVGANWNTQHTEWTWSLLLPDTLYDLVLAPMQDTYGNPLGSQPGLHFTTAPFHPGTGRLFSNVSAFSAVADPDGAISIFTVTGNSPSTYQWGRYNTQNGQFEVLYSSMSATNPVPLFTRRWQLYAWRNVRADSTAQRILGLATESNSVTSPFLSQWIVDGVLASYSGATNIVPIPPLADEAPGGALVGYTVGSSYNRAGRSPIALGISPTVVAYTDNRIEAIQVAPPNIRVQKYQCNMTSPSMPNCALDPTVDTIISDARADPFFQVIATPTCSVYSYETPTHRKSQFIFRGVCTTPPLCPIKYVETSLLPEVVKYAATFMGDGLFRVRRLSTGEFDFATRNCYSNGVWNPVGSTIAISDLAQFEPIVSGSNVGIMYLITNGDLFLYWVN